MCALIGIRSHSHALVIYIVNRVLEGKREHAKHRGERFETYDKLKELHADNKIKGW
jgi:hypothetical protein